MILCVKDKLAKLSIHDSHSVVYLLTMSSLFPEDDLATHYLNQIGNWQDPYPTPLIEIHHGIHIVRDDVLNAGTKVRGADYLIGHDPRYTHIREWVYGSCPATGYAQISLPTVCARYQKQAVLFMAQRRLDALHPYQQRGIDAGADVRWVPSGMLSVTQARAREYVAESPTTRMLLPMGLDHPTVSGSFIRVARNIPLAPRYVWSVGSSGTLNRALQLAWPDAEVHVVSTGHQMTEHEIGCAQFHRSPYAWKQAVPVQERPPFPSAVEYDAKAWMPMLNWYRTVRPVNSGDVLFWNVGA